MNPLVLLNQSPKLMPKSLASLMTIGADGTIWWPFCVKNARKAALISCEVMFRLK